MKRKTSTVKWILGFLFACCGFTLRGQDAHFSQFYDASVLLNPARAGFINGTYQLSGIYRSQWNTVTLPFKTLAGTVNMNIPAGKNRNNIAGIAISNYADKAGDASYTTNHFGGTFAFHRNFGENFNHYLGFGTTGSYVTTTFDFTELTFDEDFTNGVNTEAIGSEQSNYFDVAFGVEYNFLKEDRQLSLSAAIFHFLEPEISYSTNSQSVVYRKYCLSAAYAKNIASGWDLLPRFAGFMQGPSRELILGTEIKYHLTESATTNYALYAGAYYRVGDAFIPKFRIDMGDLSISFAYDFTSSKLSEANENAGGPEISLLYIGRIKGISAGRIYNPRF